MSLLLDLLKVAHTIYKNMENTRLGSFLGVRYTKAPILKDIFDTHLKLMANGATPEQEKLLAEAVLNIQYPDSKNAQASSIASKAGENEAKDEMPNKKKFEIITDILKVGAKLQLGALDLDAGTKQVDELTPLFNKEFAGIEDADYLIVTVKARLKDIHDLKTIQAYKTRFVETEIECGQKTRKITELEASLKEAQESLAKTKKESDSIIAAQHEYDKEILALKAKLYPTSAGNKVPDVTLLSEILYKEREAHKLSVSANQLAMKKAQQKIVQLNAQLQEERNKNATMEKMLTEKKPPSPRQTSPALSAINLPYPFGGLGANKSPAIFSGNRNVVNNAQSHSLTTSNATATLATTPLMKLGRGGSDIK